MATTLALPNITGLDKEQCVPQGNQRLWNYFTVDLYTILANKIFKPHVFMSTNKFNLPYQKMVDRYQFLTSDGVKPQCQPLCPEGWYFDCKTETCKKYSSYIAILNDRKEYVLSAKSFEPTIVEYNEETPWWYPQGESLFGLAARYTAGLQPLYTVIENLPFSRQTNRVTISSVSGYTKTKDAEYGTSFAFDDLPVGNYTISVYPKSGRVRS